MQLDEFYRTNDLSSLTHENITDCCNKTQEEIRREADTIYPGLQNLHFNVDLNVFQFVTKSLIALTGEMSYYRLPATSRFMEFDSCKWREMLADKYQIESLDDLILKFDSLGFSNIRCFRAIAWAFALHSSTFSERSSQIEKCIETFREQQGDIYVALANLRLTQSGVLTRDLLETTTRLHNSLTEVALALETATSEEQILNFLNVLGGFVIDCLDGCSASTIEENYKLLLFIVDKYLSVSKIELTDASLQSNFKKLGALTKSVCRTNAIKSLAAFGIPPALVLKLNVLFTQETNILEYRANSDVTAVNAIEQLLIYGGSMTDFRVVLNYIDDYDMLQRAIYKSEGKSEYILELLAALGMHTFKSESRYLHLVKQIVEQFDITFDDSPKPLAYEITVLDFITMHSLETGKIAGIWDWVNKDYFDNFIENHKDSQYPTLALRFALLEDSQIEDSPEYFNVVRNFTSRRDFDEFLRIVKRIEAGQLDAEEFYRDLGRNYGHLNKISDMIKYNTEFMSASELRDLINWHLEIYKQYNLSSAITLAVLLCADSSLDAIIPEIPENRDALTEVLQTIDLPYQVRYLFKRFLELNKVEQDPVEDADDECVDADDWEDEDYDK